MVPNKRKQNLCSAMIPVLGIVWLLFMFFISAPSHAQEQEDAYFEDLVLAVFVDRQRLSPGIFAVQQGGRYYLPMGQLSEVLDFHVDIDRESRFVEGWAISKDRSFSIDAVSGLVRYGDKSATLPEEAFLDPDIVDDDAYILLEVLNQIWPLQFDVNLSALILNIEPDDLLPFQKVLERKNRQKKLLEIQANRDREKADPLPFIAYPYQAFSLPSLGVETQIGYDAQTNSPEWNFQLNGVQDLAYASADYSVAISQRNGELKKPENFRLRFKRQNIHEGALPYGLEDTRWGDVRLVNRDLISSGLTGRGFVFSSRPTSFENQFDLITVDGIGTPGWETELYINNELIDFGAVDERGEYRFEDVSIGYGNNRVRVVLYGPQGQIHERIENYFYQSDMVKKGENVFSGGIIDSQRDFIPIEKFKTNRPEGLAANLYGARGIADRLTVFATANTIRDRDGTTEVSRQYVSAGAIGSFKSTLAQAEIYKEIGAGQAVDMRTLSDFKGFKINTQLALYSDFESPDAKNGDSAKEREFEFSIKRIFATALGSLGLEVGADYLKRKNGTTTKAFTTRQSMGKSGVRVTNQTKSNLVNSDHTATTGRLSSSVRMRNWLLRNSLNYNLYPETDVSSIQGELRYGRRKDFSTAFRLQRNFASDETIAGVQVAKNFDQFLGSVDADWSSIYGASLMLRASTAFGPYGPDGDYIMQSDSLQASGPISSHVYFDKDYSGTFNEGDEPVPDTKIAFGRRISQDETDEEGYLTKINTVSGSGEIDVTVAQSSIDDPYFVPGHPGYSMYPRPGVIHRLQFPLIETGAIDGTLRWEAGGKPVSGVILELIDAEGDIVQSTQTAIDGYFTFERIPPGNYIIRSSSEDEIDIPFKYVDLTPDNLFQFGMDMDVVDLAQLQQENELSVNVDKEGAISVKNILSLAKGVARKKKAKREIEAKKLKILQDAGYTSSSREPAVVEAVRIGQHPDKVRMVMDLSAPTDYVLNYDPDSNSIFVEMPYASWGARESWQAKSGNLLDNYKAETLPSGGRRLILGVKDGIEIAASGLLKANGDKKDRLYIDIAKK